MTYKEALNQTNSLIQSARYAQCDYVDGVDVVLLDVCQNLLKKEIPQKPLQKTHSERFDFMHGQCPSCHGCIHDEMNYCEKCGQKLNWK